MDYSKFNAGIMVIGGTADPWLEDPVGRIGSSSSDSNDGPVRPVISLKSCVTVKSGNGTSDTPYEVSIDNECSTKVN